jgi:precorrin-2 dehydrogenase/sirohydrochlorin ferrochelatase
MGRSLYNLGKYYPLMVDLSKMKCLVVGGGAVALRKTMALNGAGADITLISPEILPPLAQLADAGEICLLKRPYQKGDLQGFQLVYVAINNQKISEEIRREALEARIFINIADQPAAGNFIVPSQIQRGDLMLCFSTNGKSPLLSKKIRRELEERYGEEYEEFLHLLGRERAWALKEIGQIELRKAYFQALVYSDLPELIKAGKTAEIQQQIAAIREKTLSKKIGGTSYDQ